MSWLFHSVDQIKETYLQDIYAIIRKKKSKTGNIKECFVARL